jgi:hypothetical protein
MDDSGAGSQIRIYPIPIRLFSEWNDAHSDLSLLFVLFYPNGIFPGI